MLTVRLLSVFLRGMLMEMRSCSVRVKKLIKVGLSEGGDVRLDFTLKSGEGAHYDCYREKSNVLACIS